MLNRIKSLLVDRDKLEYNLKWVVRLLLLLGVIYMSVYITFFNDVKVVTNYVEHTHSDSVLIIYDKEITEKKLEKEDIKRKRYEVYHYIDSVPRDVDSIAKYIIRSTAAARSYP